MSYKNLIISGTFWDDSIIVQIQSQPHIEIEIKMDELDLTAAESKATYDEIKAYVLNKYGLKVSQLYIAQIKRKCGIIERKIITYPKRKMRKYRSARQRKRQRLWTH